MTEEQPAWRKLHPLTPVIDGGVGLIIVVGIIIANLRDVIINAFIGDRWTDDFDEFDGDADEWNPVTYVMQDGRIIFVILGIIAIIALGLGIAWMSWFFHSYQINDDAVEMKKGVIFKKHRRAPLERIQSVNLQRPLLARVFGLTKIEIQTGGHDGKVDLAYLSHGDAKKVRQQILYTAAAVTDAFAPVDDSGNAYPESTHEVDRRAKEFLDFDVDAEVTAAESLVKVPAGRLLGSILTSHESIIIYVVAAALPLLAIELGWFVLAGILPVVITLVGLSISRFNRGFNFMISQSGDGIRTGSGLTSTYTNTVPRRRIHAIDITQPLVWRLFGWWRIRLTTAGSSTSSTSSNQKVLENVVLPVGKLNDVLAILPLILPHLDSDEEKERIIDALVGPGTGFTTAGQKAGGVLLFGRRRAGLALTHEDTQDAAVRIRRGAITRHLVLMPVVRAQSILLHRPMAHHLLGLASVHLHTVVGPVSVYMRGLELHRAQALWAELAKTTVRVQQLDPQHHRVPNEHITPHEQATPQDRATPQDHPATYEQTTPDETIELGENHAK